MTDLVMVGLDYTVLPACGVRALLSQNKITATALAQISTPLVVAHGTYETPEFQRQTRDFAAALKAANKPVQYLVNENYNHFEMMETFASPYGLLGRAVLEQMQLQLHST